MLSQQQERQVAPDVTELMTKAEALKAAINETIGAGDRTTPDLGGDGNTDTFADAIIERL